MSETFRVLLVDDHDIVRQGMKSVLRAHPEFNVVAEASDGEAAVRAAIKEKPDLVVMDVRMPKLDGIEACREIRAAVPAANVLMLTSYTDEKAVMAAIIAGASGFMLKEVNTADLLDAMRTVAAGGQDARSSIVRDRYRPDPPWKRCQRRRPPGAITDGARTEDPGTCRRRPDEPRDWRAALPQRADGEASRERYSRKART